MQRRSASPAQQGFTLLELMLVVLVLGLLVSAIRLSVPDNPDQQARSLAQRLGAQLQLAQQQAVMKNQDLALQFGPDQYGFFQLDNNQWRPLADDSPLAPTQLPQPLQFELEIAGQPVNLNASPEPQVLLLSDGQVTAFALTISSPEVDKALSVEVGLLGDVRIDDRGASDDD